MNPFVKKKLIPLLATLCGIACGWAIYLNLYPERWLQNEPALSASDLALAGPEDSIIGREAGEGIPLLESAKDFEAMGQYHYVTAQPVEAIPTGVYSLKPWVEPYTTRRHKGRVVNRRRKEEVIQGAGSLTGDYNQYYLLKLPDGSYLLGQLHPLDAAAIARGKTVTLPIGAKTPVSAAAQGYLDELCAQYGASNKSALYTFDNAWYQQNELLLLAVQGGTAVAAGLAVAVGLLLLGERVVKRWEARQESAFTPQ